MLPITKGINEWIKARTADWDRPLKVVGLLATTDEGCAIYSNQTRKACEKVNVGFEIRTLEHDFEIVKSAIEQVNHDYEVDGLIIYFPLFGPDKDNELRALISPRIDIEAISPSSLAKVYTSTPGTLAEMGIGFPSHSVFPCTPLAVVRVLQSLKTMYDHLRPSGQRLSGKVISVINRSETVGRPLAAMLANEGALIFSIDIDSIHIYHRHSAADHYCVTPLPKTVETNDCLRLSDVVVSAVPSAKYKVDTAVLKTGCVCVNIATDNNFAEDVKDRAGVWVQRVGSVTIANLISNAVILRLASECA
ncbi:hypothetical protein TREMEDRAFT_30073 [Tremella mesenterica DSM 1558]|nr:uncharacterized protein TREMEDRAFT_30073 [Tremella mesenterica DSM 1558]EIW70075.1 hypothetical protein TREMEDRAFT_30073 [Tremella mesenterica DSM 1558]